MNDPVGSQRWPITPRSRLIDEDILWWETPTMVVRLDSKRRLTVPTALGSARPGDVFEAEFDADEDAIVFRRLAGKGDWLAVLLACPVPMDDLPTRRRESFKSKL